MRKLYFLDADTQVVTEWESKIAPMVGNVLG